MGREIRHSVGEISFSVIRRPRKTIVIRVKEGLVEVVADPRVSLEYIFDLVEKKEKWIKNKLKLSLPKKELIYENGEEHYYLGKAYLLNIRVVEDKADEGIFLENDILSLSTLNDAKEYKKKILEAWYRNMAKYYFNRIAEGLCDKLKPDGISMPEIFVRKMSRRWGTCHYYKKRIILNLSLIKASVELIRYVILHELCHFKYPNHSKEFYEYMGQFEPELKMKKEKLKTFEKVL